jgi:hypothetical protein
MRDLARTAFRYAWPEEPAVCVCMYVCMYVCMFWLLKSDHSQHKQRMVVTPHAEHACIYTYSQWEVLDHETFACTSVFFYLHCLTQIRSCAAPAMNARGEHTCMHICGGKVLDYETCACVCFYLHCLTWIRSCAAQVMNDGDATWRAARRCRSSG